MDTVDTTKEDTKKVESVRPPTLLQLFADWIAAHEDKINCRYEATYSDTALVIRKVKP